MKLWLGKVAMSLLLMSSFTVGLSAQSNSRESKDKKEKVEIVAVEKKEQNPQGGADESKKKSRVRP